MNRRPPARLAVADSLDAAIVDFEGQPVLTTLISPPEASSPLILRYGVALLEQPDAYMVPELIALDYGDFLAGEQAWDFVLNRGNLYPRADVIGHLQDGTDEMLPLKWLDLAAPIAGLVYEHRDQWLPLAVIRTVVSNRHDLPERVRDHLDVYPNWKAWQGNG
jgi:hypothetical protein